MLDSLTSDNWRDFQQRYQGCYGWVLTNNKEVPVYVSRVTDTAVTFTGLSGEEYFTYANKDVKFKFAPLNRRLVIGASGELYYIARRPARQWSRGVSESNTLISRIRGSRATPAGITPEIMSDILSGTTSKVTKGTVGEINNVLLSDLFAISGNILYMFNLSSGTITGDVINVSRPLFMQEVVDAVRDSKLSYKVALA